jgi:hypothetical protein
MKLADLWPSDRLTEGDLLHRAKAHLLTIFGDSLRPTHESSDGGPDMVALTDDGRLIVFEVKQPKKEFALGFSEISHLVDLKGSIVTDRPVSVVLITGREVSPTSRRLLLEHDVHVVKLGDSVGETRRSLEAEFPDGGFVRDRQT